jgi:hypothetical protein
MGSNRWGLRRWEWLWLCGDYGRGGDGTCVKIRMDRRLRVIMAEVRGGEWVCVRRWCVRNGAC